MKKPKTNSVSRPSRWGAMFVLSVLAVTAVGIAVFIGYDQLRDIWREQGIITDYDNQVSIQSGKMVKADVIAGIFGLKTGANLNTIDFALKREQALEKIANLRELKIRRQLPDRVTITIEEREPIARVGLKGLKRDTGKVVDSEGVVFYCSRGTQLLPLIRESSAPGTSAGHRLEARAKAALKFVEVCRDPAFHELGILEVDSSPHDFLLATINTGSNYTQLKLAWEDMDAPSTPASTASLIRQLTHLRDAIRTRLGEGSVIWNATDFSSPGRIYADTKGKL